MLCCVSRLTASFSFVTHLCCWEAAEQSQPAVVGLPDEIAGADLLAAPTLIRQTLYVLHREDRFQLAAGTVCLCLRRCGETKETTLP